MDRTESTDAPREDLMAEVRRLRALLDAAQEFGRVSVFERDVATGEGRWDPHIFRLFGVSPQAGTPSIDAVIGLVDPRDRERMRREYESSLRRPGRHETRFRVRHADGRETHLHAIWHVPREGHRVVGVIIDDTETVLLAQRHQQARTHLSLLAKMVGLTIWRTDLTSGRVYSDEQLWNLGEDAPPDGGIAVDDYRALMHADDLAQAERARDEALDGSGPAVAECRYRHADGGYRTLLTRRVAERDAAGRPVALIGVGIDISEQVQARERFAQLLERYEMVVEATGIGVWTWDAGAGRHVWNAAMREIYGLAAGAPLPSAGPDGITAMIVPEDLEAVRAALRRIQAPGNPSAEVTYRIRREDGSLRTLVGRARQLRSEPLLLCGIALDVSELQAGAQALRDKEAAERANRAKSAFLSRISHELRTPLNAVMGFSSLLLGASADPLTAVQREQLGHILEAGRHLLGLVDDLLAIGQDTLELGADPSQHCDLAAVVDQVLDAQAEAARAAGVQLSQSGGCPRVVGAERHWRQVVGNLVSNAIKFNRRGGHVQVAVRDLGPVEGVELDIADTGRGIDAALQRQVFEPLNRLGAERLGIPGTGLGLAIARQLVQAMGGSLAIESQAGDGTRVRVRARRSEAVAPVPAPAANEVGASAGRADLDVVYVEDNEVNVLLVREFLAMRPGLRLHVADTVGAAVELLQRVQPWLLLVDMHLPDGDGHELLRRLRAGGNGTAAGAARHCIALSADVVPAEIERARRGGFEDYWAKPIDLLAFLAGIDRLLAGVGADPAVPSG